MRIRVLVAGLVVARILRKLRLLEAAYYAASFIDSIRYFRSNRKFRCAHPDFAAPPAKYIFETSRSADLETFYAGGRRHAEAIYQALNSHLPDGPLRICEWGCGVARLVRHMPSIDLSRSIDVYASDYSTELIEWCQANVEGVVFRTNDLEPPLPFTDCEFDAIYSASVFTHLPLELNRPWIEENIRVVKPGGLVYFSVHGDRYKYRLLPSELRRYEDEGVVVRGGVKAGAPWFTVYHSPWFVEEELLRGYEVAYKRTFSESERRPRQDSWVIRKAA